MEEKVTITKKTSVIPIYIATGAWILAALFLKMIHLSDYLICLVISIVTYFIANKLCKPIEIRTVEKVSSNHPMADEFLAKMEQYTIELNELDKSIDDERVSQSIVEIIEIMNEISKLVYKEPTLYQQLRKFMNYYLPTLIKLSHSYQSLEDSLVEGENTSSTASKIEEAMQLATQAFKKQLDLLYSNQAMDISSDITVLETLMKQQGLVEETNSTK